MKQPEQKKDVKSVYFQNNIIQMQCFKMALDNDYGK